MSYTVAEAPRPSFSTLTQEQERALQHYRRQEVALACQRHRIHQLERSCDPLLLTLLPQSRQQLALLEQEHAQTDRQLQELAAALQKQIQQLPPERLQRILRYRHLEMLSWHEISALMGLDSRWIMRLNRKAIEELEREEPR